MHWQNIHSTKSLMGRAAAVVLGGLPTANSQPPPSTIHSQISLVVFKKQRL
jgi:hypothetical protein